MHTSRSWTTSRQSASTLQTRIVATRALILRTSNRSALQRSSTLSTLVNSFACRAMRRRHSNAPALGAVTSHQTNCARHASCWKVSTEVYQASACAPNDLAPPKPHWRMQRVTLAGSSHDLRDSPHGPTLMYRRPDVFSTTPSSIVFTHWHAIRKSTVARSHDAGPMHLVALFGLQKLSRSRQKLNIMTIFGHLFVTSDGRVKVFLFTTMSASR